MTRMGKRPARAFVPASSIRAKRCQDAFSRFDQLERRVDFAEGRADAMGLGAPKTLEEEIAELQANERVDAELEALKAAQAKKSEG